MRKGLRAATSKSKKQPVTTQKAKRMRGNGGVADNISPSSSADSTAAGTTSSVWELHNNQRPLWQRLFSFPFWRSCLVPTPPYEAGNDENQLRSRQQHQTTTAASKSSGDSVYNDSSQHASTRNDYPLESPMTHSASSFESDPDCAVHHSDVAALVASQATTATTRLLFEGGNGSSADSSQQQQPEAQQQPAIEVVMENLLNIEPSCSASLCSSVASKPPVRSVPPPPPFPPPPLSPTMEGKRSAAVVGQQQPQQQLQRPPRATQRSASCAASAIPNSPPKSTTKASTSLQRPETNRNRALSTCSTNSRHRRGNVALNLPPMQSLVDGELKDEDLKPPEVPKDMIPVVTIDPVQCRRQISAWDDDDVFNLSSDSDDEGAGAAAAQGVCHGDDDDDESCDNDDLSDDGSASPTSVVHSRTNKASHHGNGSKSSSLVQPPRLPPLTSTASSAVPATTPSWMHAWAGESAKTCISPETVRDEKVVHEATLGGEAVDSSGAGAAAAARYTVTYLPLEPRPACSMEAEGSASVVFTGGWVCAYGDGVQGNDIALDGNAKASASLYFLQLLQGGILQLLPASLNDSAATAIQVPLTTRDTVQVLPASLSSSVPKKLRGTGGCCLAIESASVCLWPVPVPEGVESVSDLLLHFDTYHGKKSHRKDLTATTFKADLAALDTSLRSVTQNTTTRNEYDQCAVVSDDESQGVDLDSVAAPQAQHDAVLHLRFAIDAALRS